MDVEPRLQIDATGTRRWRVNGRYHRTDGPAVERFDGVHYWYVDGLLHRTDGPAIESADGQGWCLNDRLYTSFTQWLHALNCTDAERLLLILKYSH